MAIAGGTCGTCTWSISDAGLLTVRPTSGGSGNLELGNSLGIDARSWPWHQYRDKIKQISLSGTITTSYTFFETYTGDYSSIFENCINLTGITGIGSLTGAKSCRFMFSHCEKIQSIDISSFDTSLVTNMAYMFGSCSSLTSLNLSGIDTSRVTDFSGFLSWCSSLTSVDISSINTTRCDYDNNGDAYDFFIETPLLSQIIIGPNFYIKPYSQYSASEYPHYSNTCFNGGRNTTNGIVVTSNAAFSELTNAQRAGTWERTISTSYSVSAVRTTGGTADEDGENVTITVRWSTDAETTDRRLRIYQKEAGASAYPSTPVINQTLNGDSGVTPVTISNIGDKAYDFKVEFYDGTNTYIAFPSIQSNIRLITIDEEGDLCLKLDITASSDTTDAELFSAINALNWNNDVLVT